MAIWKLCLLLCLVFTESRSCPLHWSSYGEKCYRFFSYSRTWDDAESTCLTYGSNLASVHSVSEYRFLQSLISARSGSYALTWLGGVDAVKEGRWFWSDGSEVNFYYWASHQPDNYWSNEHCMEMNYGDELRMNDNVCSRVRSFVCKK